LTVQVDDVSTNGLGNRRSNDDRTCEARQQDRGSTSWRDRPSGRERADEIATVVEARDQPEKRG
jgi:hypothetical protein